MHLPRSPITVPKRETKSTPVESPSGFWPLGENGRASILRHSIDQHSPNHAADAARPANDPTSAMQLAALRSQFETLPDPISFFNNLFAYAPIGCSVVGIDGRLLASNAAANKIFGSQPPTDYNVFTDHLAIEIGLVTAIRRGFLGETVTLPTQWYDPKESKHFESKNGESKLAPVSESKQVAIAISVFPVASAHQRIDHVAVIYRDDTAAMLAQQQLQRQSEQLEQHVISRTAELEEANDELEAFSYSVSHDLRAPVRAIDAFATLLSEDDQSQLSGSARDCLRRIRKSTARMSDLINDLLSFSRLGKQALTLKTVAPMQLVHQVLQELEPKLSDRALNIRIGKLPLVQADAALLREVFLNLLDNAIKFSSKCEHARIEVGTRVQDDRLVWYVADNGVGFDMDHYQRLFGVFSRLHSMDEFEGTGVGLALVQRIVKRHGGDVWAHAEVGKGATFYFTLAE